MDRWTSIMRMHMAAFDNRRGGTRKPDERAKLTRLQAKIDSNLARERGKRPCERMAGRYEQLAIRESQAFSVAGLAGRIAA